MIQRNNPLILVIDDEPQIRRFIRVGLTASGYEMLEAGDAATGLSLFRGKNPDLIILDLGLPDQDGKMVIATIRQTSATPILILSARTDEAEKIEALDLGADDYVTKPFSVGEMMARIRAAFRHRLRRQVFRDGAELKLSKKEYAMLAVFVQSAGLVVTHNQLLKAVWGDVYADDTAYLRVFIRQLRQKIEPDPTQPRHIITEAGVGYRLKIHV
jgi:two-component system, OmpR family, KDP operon response regulator KdpE